MVLLLVIVVASYRQTCFAYPNGGGAYTVSRDNLGEDASLVAATSLLIDYVLTVAVSVVAGVAAVTSAVPSLAPHAVGALDRVRGAPDHGQPARDQGVRPRVRDPHVRIRGLPSTRCSLVAFVKIGFGDGITAESAHYELRQTADTGGLLTVFLVLRAFASGCTALTGVEAVSNGIPAFQPPKSRNAAATLLDHGAAGDHDVRGNHRARHRVARAHGRGHRGAGRLPRRDASAPRSARSALATFGDGAMFFLLQGFTAAILVLAANTAFNGFPVLSSLLGRHGYLPHQLANRGDRLVFSNGILVLAGLVGRC